jgi:hypothetical protein
MEVDVSGLPGPVVDWSITGGSGSGVITDPGSASTTFEGDEGGEVEITVRIIDGTAGVDISGTVTVWVIELDEIEDNIVAQMIEQQSVGGGAPAEYEIPFQDADGAIAQVEILLPGGQGVNFQIGVDVKMVIDHANGNVKLLFFRRAGFVVRIIRRLAGVEKTKLVRINYGTPSSDKGACPDAGDRRLRKIPGNADLILVSGSANDNGFLANAQQVFAGNCTIIHSVQDAIDAITNHPGHGIRVLIVDHGSIARVSLGSGTESEAGKHLDGTSATQTDRAAFAAACNGKVLSMTLVGSCIAATVAGQAFCQQMADAGHMRIKAPNAVVKLTVNPDGSSIWWITQGGKLIRVMPA